MDRPTDGWTDGPTDGPTDGQTHPLIESWLTTKKMGFEQIIAQVFAKKQNGVFLDAFSHLYKRVCPSVRRSVRPSVRRSVRPSVGPSRVFFGSPKMREIELGAAKGVSERQGGQRLDGERLISCIRTCYPNRRRSDQIHRGRR